MTVKFILILRKTKYVGNHDNMAVIICHDSNNCLCQDPCESHYRNRDESDNNVFNMFTKRCREVPPESQQVPAEGGVPRALPAGLRREMPEAGSCGEWIFPSAVQGYRGFSRQKGSGGTGVDMKRVGSPSRLYFSVIDGLVYLFLCQRYNKPALNVIFRHFIYFNVRLVSLLDMYFLIIIDDLIYLFYARATICSSWMKILSVL